MASPLPFTSASRSVPTAGNEKAPSGTVIKAVSDKVAKVFNDDDDDDVRLFLGCEKKSKGMNYSVGILNLRMKLKRCQLKPE